MTVDNKSIGDKVFDLLNAIFLIFLCIIMLYPLYYVLVGSLSDGASLMKHRGLMWKPLGFSTAAYKMVFRNPMILKGFFNSILLVIIGTSINMIMTAFAAYVTSRKNVYWSKLILMLAILTMMFERGLIPFYLQVKSLGLLNTHWSIIFSFAIATYNMIIMRTYFLSIPVSLEESARMDGANDFTILFRIILPVAKPVVATLVLFYGVSRWNGYFYVMIFLKDRVLFPISLILREILISSDAANNMSGAGGSIGDVEMITDTIKYATTIVATVPILLIYPFLQKHFVKGAMIGSVKG